jgi:hypothetical protein
MSDPSTGRELRTQALRLLLYPVIFSPDLLSETDRVCRLFNGRPHDELAGVTREARAELDQPMLLVAQIEALVGNPTEAQVRAYLTAVVQQLEADLLLRDGA